MTIKELRKENKMTQAEFAESIGVHTQSVAAYEKGRTKPSQKVLDKIEEVYGVTVDTTVTVAKTAREQAMEAAEKTAKEAKKTARKTKEEAIKVADSAKYVGKKTAEQAVDIANEVKKGAKKTAKAAKTGGKKFVEEVAKAVGVAKKTRVVIQSPLGGEITPDEILEKTGSVDEVYIRVDQNKAHWVKGEESGSVDLW